MWDRLGELSRPDKIAILAYLGVWVYANFIHNNL